jgi:hypothetical protein
MTNLYETSVGDLEGRGLSIHRHIHEDNNAKHEMDIKELGHVHVDYIHLTGHDPVVGCCDHDNEILVPTKACNSSTMSAIISFATVLCGVSPYFM